MTDQRRGVVQINSNSADRSMGAYFLKRMLTNDDRIGVPIVDRTLHFLNAEQIFGRYDFGAGVARYEPTENEFINRHSVIVRNGEVGRSRDQTVEQRPKRITEDLGYPIVGEWFQRYYGFLNEEGALQ